MNDFVESLPETEKILYRTIQFIASDYIEFSYEKAQCQRDDWYKRVNKCLQEYIIAKDQ
jgi:hypothetical protein